MEPDKEMLSAFMDGELSAVEMERIGRILAERRDLMEWVESQEILRQSLKGAYDGILSAPIPERLLATTQAAPVSLLWRLRQGLRSLSAPLVLPAGVALAFGVAIGILVRPAADFSLGAIGLEARGQLAHTLDTQLASAGYREEGPRIGLSFRNRLGQDCRTFADKNEAGLACHQDGQWTIPVLVHQSSQSGASYQMAGSEMPDAVRRAVEKNIVGEPFDAKAERRAREQGWTEK